MVATYDFQSTRNEIMQRALRQVGALADGETMSAEMASGAAIALNAMVKSWQNDNIFLWTLVTTAVTTVANQASNTLTASNLIGIDQAYLRENTTDTFLQVKGWTDYQMVTRKGSSSTGRPTDVYFDEQLAPSVYFYPTPNAAYTIYLSGIQRLQDFDTGTDLPGFPTRWEQALTWGLASELSSEYPLSVNERMFFAKKADIEKTAARKGNRQLKTNDFTRSIF